MAKTRKPGALYFTGLAINRKGRVTFTGHYYLLEESNDRRTAVPQITDGQWSSYDDLSGIVHAIRFTDVPERQLLLLARTRGIYRIGAKGVTFQKIDEQRKAGFFMDLRRIAGHWYIVGGHHQIYREDGAQWNRFDTGVFVSGKAGEAKILLSIDGLASDDIYAVGFNGVILHYNGRAWSALASPTDSGFQRVLCVGPEEVYLCGNGNGLYRGSTAGWQALTEPDSKVVYYDMARFKGKIYVCTKRNLYVIQKNAVVEVDIPVKGPLGFYRMEATENELWTCGSECVLCFDGKTWTQYVYPDNT